MYIYKSIYIYIYIYALYISIYQIIFPPRNSQNRSTRSKVKNNREKHDQKKINIFIKGRTTVIIVL